MPGFEQKRSLDRFDAESAIEDFLESEQPHQHWSQILDALEKLKNPPCEINKKLREVKWLPIDAGQSPQSPQDVIYLKGMKDEVAQIVDRFDDFVHVLRLTEEFS